jgi:hypothetical protein
MAAEAWNVGKLVRAMDHVDRWGSVVVPWESIPLRDSRTLLIIAGTTGEVCSLIVVYV